MDPSYEQLIKCLSEAITTGLNIGVQYKGFQRFCTPHLLAETQDGRLVLQAFQYGGSSSKGPVDASNGGWRWLYIDEMDALAVGAGTSYPVDLQKAEGSYAPPAFIVQILAMRNR